MPAHVQRSRAWRWAAAAALAWLVPALAPAQDNLIMKRGQRIAPIYEGWIANPDGTFDLIFGYFNLNSEEHINVPVGPDNSIEPGGPDLGQPAYFFPRRSRFTFRVTVPADFGERELVWKITANGETEYAYATLKPDYIIDERIMMMNNGGFGGRGQRLGEPDNVVPTVRLDGPGRTHRKGRRAARAPGVRQRRRQPARRYRRFQRSRVGHRLVRVPRPGRTRNAGTEQEHPEYRRQKARAAQLRKTAFSSARRASAATTGGGASQMELPPPEVVTDRPVEVTATFSEPGTYTLRAMAHDGGLHGAVDVTVTVE